MSLIFIIKGLIVNRIFHRHNWSTLIICTWTWLVDWNRTLKFDTSSTILLPNIMKKPVKMKHMSNPETDQPWHEKHGLPSQVHVLNHYSLQFSPICLSSHQNWCLKSEERYIVNDDIMNYGNMILDFSRKVIKNVVTQFKGETENYSNILFGQWHGLHYLTLTII